MRKDIKYMKKSLAQKVKQLSAQNANMKSILTLLKLGLISDTKYLRTLSVYDEANFVSS